MSKLYKKVELFVSRSFYHGGDGLEDQGLRVFRSKEEYDAEAAKNGWHSGKSFKTSWCVPPIKVEALVEARRFRRFESGENLSFNDVALIGYDAQRAGRLTWAAN